MTKKCLWGPLAAVVFIICCTSTTAIFVRGIPELPRGGILPNGGKIWALLVAGSNGYYNYRHQVIFMSGRQLIKKLFSINSTFVFVSLGRCLPRVSDSPQKWDSR